MGESDFHERTKDFAVRVVGLFGSLPQTTAARIMGKQMFRAGTSVGAHYAEASHSKSPADFVSKIDGARQEMQEFLYWLDIIRRTKQVKPELLGPIESEAREILAILITMSNNTRSKMK